MAATNEEIARDLLIAAMGGIAVGRSEDQAEQIATAYKTILEGVDEASAANAERSRKRSGF